VEKAKMKTITFRHRYHKLLKSEFTTIRGRSWLKLKAGERVLIETLDGSFKADVVFVEPRRIADLSVEFLKADAEYPGFVIRDRPDFVALLNSFIPKHWGRPQVTVDSEMAVVTLRRVA
jgi:hypothetical protein